jgi:hypothetical protein
MNPRGEGLRRIEGEIAREKVAALDHLARAIEATRDEARRDELRDAYRATRARARTARLHVLIQRETLGLRSHRVVDQQFPEPVWPPWL